MRYTPGPWKLSEDGREILGKCFTGQYRYICSRVTGGSPEQAGANARLMVAAPDLIEALQAVVGEMRREHDVGDGHFSTAEVEAAEYAIAKAHGERPQNADSPTNRMVAKE